MTWSGLLKAASYLGIFLIGLRWMSRAISRSSGEAFNKLLARLTDSLWRSFGTGFLVTAVLQSSSLTTVLVVSLINAGVMTLAQGFGVIIGSNVGTTITGQLLSFNLYWLAWPLLAISALCALIPHAAFRKAAAPLSGCALLLIGMAGMSSELAAIKESETFFRALQMAGETPWKGILVGMIAAATLQSSSAVMGIALGLAQKGLLTLPCGLSLVIGADLGTCSTALIASIGMDITARRAAWFHFVFNLFSLLLAAILYPHLLFLAVRSAASLPRRLANAHFLYNLLGALVLLPLTAPLARCLGKTNFKGTFRH